MSGHNKAIVRRMIEEHWNGKNAALVTEFFTPTVSLLTPDGGLTGLAGASRLLGGYATGFPDFRITIDDVVAEGDTVAVRWTFSGTNRGALGDIPATGKAVSVPNVIGIFRLVAGKVQQAHFAWDRYELRQQLGLMPAGSSTAQA
jgi:predicted ester cyclase